MSDEKATEPSKIFCRYEKFYWCAKCSVGKHHFETQKTTHGGARQAADEIVDLVSKLTGIQNIPMRRLYPKIYEIVVPNAKLTDS